ncbi:MAG: hypothetical protein JWO59_204 [Chloroflexi bacterium]|nr:hypothetical protein [Chloroflexota bacterium]
MDARRVVRVAVAQLERASARGAGGCAFDSHRQHNGPVAQLAERHAVYVEDAGSTPVGIANVLEE